MSLTHLDKTGKAQMVNVAAKPVTARTAIVEGYITLQPTTLKAITKGKVPKGEVLNTAKIAAIQAAKHTADLIPLCHPLALDAITVDFKLEPKRIRITATASISAKTGVEMEALTAVAVAALTIYDMCKAIDKTMTVTGIRLLSKTGGSKAK